MFQVLWKDLSVWQALLSIFDIFITKGFLYLHIKLSINMLFLFLGGGAGKALEAGFLEVWM